MVYGKETCVIGGARVVIDAEWVRAIHVDHVGHRLRDEDQGDEEREYIFSESETFAHINKRPFFVVRSVQDFLALGRYLVIFLTATLPSTDATQSAMTTIHRPQYIRAARKWNPYEWQKSDSDWSSSSSGPVVPVIMSGWPATSANTTPPAHVNICAHVTVTGRPLTAAFLRRGRATHQRLGDADLAVRLLGEQPAEGDG